MQSWLRNANGFKNKCVLDDMCPRRVSNLWHATELYVVTAPCSSVVLSFELAEIYPKQIV